MRAIILFAAIAAHSLALPVEISSTEACKKCNALVDEIMALNAEAVDKAVEHQVDVRFNSFAWMISRQEHSPLHPRYTLLFFEKPGSKNV